MRHDSATAATFIHRGNEQAEYTQPQPGLKPEYAITDYCRQYCTLRFRLLFSPADRYFHTGFSSLARQGFIAATPLNFHIALMPRDTITTE